MTAITARSSLLRSDMRSVSKLDFMIILLRAKSEMKKFFRNLSQLHLLLNCTFHVFFVPIRRAWRGVLRRYFGKLVTTSLLELCKRPKYFGRSEVLIRGEKDGSLWMRLSFNFFLVVAKWRLSTFACPLRPQSFLWSPFSQELTHLSCLSYCPHSLSFGLLFYRSEVAIDPKP